MLNIKIYSFSYKVALPPDESGHGGGFVFDCRCLNNPGREPGFETETGIGQKVKDFLEPLPEVQNFKQHVLSLVDLSVDNYLYRGFEDLSFSFGCTGGQHRSVFFAEQTFMHLNGREGISVMVEHMNLKAKGFI